MNIKNAKTRKILLAFITVLSVFLGFMYPVTAAERSGSIPTAYWYLVSSNYGTPEQDQANHRGNYSYSAYINGYKLYSNYYFGVYTQNRYRFYGTEIYPMSCDYYVGMVKYSDPTVKYNHYVSSSTHSYDIYMPSTPQPPVNVGYEAYFYIDGTNGAEVSINGFCHTW